MRWTIHLQLLLPMLSVAVLAIALAAAASAYYGGLHTRQKQQDDLARVVATLTDANFPINDSILEKLSGLSAAEFVVLDASGALRGQTLPLPVSEIKMLRRIELAGGLADLASRPSVSMAGADYLTARVPLVRKSTEHAPLSLVVLFPEDRWWTARREAAYPPLVAGGVAVMAAALATTLLARRFVRPIQQLGVQAERIAAGDFQGCELPQRRDELGDLCQALDRMRRRLGQYEDEVRRNERLRTLGQLGAGIAHQLRNWATGARMALDLHRRECPLEPDCESLRVATRQLTLMESYLQRFLTLGQTRSLPHERLDLGVLAEEVLSLVRPACEHAHIDLTYREPAVPLPMRGDEQSLRNLLVNLLLNAVEAATPLNGRRGTVMVELEQSAPGWARMCIKDSGPGPAADVASRVFEPFVSDKRDGAGLGLSVARQVVEEHGGTVEWERKDEMTWFVVDLPLE